MIWRFLSRYRAALLTWVAVPGLLFVLASMAILGGIGLNYHPTAPGAYQFGPLLGITGCGALVMIVLAVRHSAASRMWRARRNALEVLGVVAAMGIAGLLVILFVHGPATRDVVLANEAFRIPSVYRPYAIPAENNAAKAIILEVCGPDRAPVYDSFLGCPNNQLVRYGREPLLQEFLAVMLLDQANATQQGDILQTRGEHETDAVTGALVYSDSAYAMRLWLDSTGRAEVMRICYRLLGGDCDAAVRFQDHTLFFPVIQTNATQSKQALLAEAAIWQTLFDRWRCPAAIDCLK